MKITSAGIITVAAFVFDLTTIALLARLVTGHVYIILY